MQKPVGPRVGLTLQGQPYCSSNAIFSAGPGLWSCLCGTCAPWLCDEHIRVFEAQNLKSLVLDPRDVCSCKMRCFGMLLFYNNIVNPLYCQCLNLETLITMFFLLGDHVLKDAEP